MITGNLAAAEVKKATAYQKTAFPQGIPECGADALHFSLIAYTTAVPTGAGPTADITPYTQPTISPTDSPPYIPSGPQSKPDDDDDFTSTYTYTEFPLTLGQMGKPPLTTGVPLPSGTELPKLPCMVTAGPKGPFTLLNENFIPMVSRSNSIGPLSQPTAAPAANDPILDPVNYKAPSFFLKAVAGLTDVFDLVYTATGQYVAKTSSGRVMVQWCC